jgi:2-deoxy-D-gluconate 3-dehydrogenase
MAIALAQAGADIVGVSRSEALATASLVRDAGRQFHGVLADLGRTGSVTRIIEEATRTYGTVDILVNNAGTIRRDDALTFREEDWDDVINVNLKSVFFLSQAFARHLVERKAPGKIINIASMLSFQGGIRVPSYTASKSGVLGLTRLLANEWAVHGINVNSIAPGYMSTNNTAPLREDVERSREILGRIPAGRWGAPEDLAGPVVFLASTASDYVHGATLVVDGGWLAR